MRKTPEPLIRAMRRLRMRDFSADQIADLLDVSVRTVYAHTSDISAKRGRRPGQRTMTPERIELARDLWRRGTKPVAIAMDLGVTEGCIRHHCGSVPRQHEGAE